MQIESCRAVVTGGAGFIGSHLVDRLLHADNDVLVLDDFSTGSLNNLAHHAGNPRLQVEPADVRNTSEMEVAFADADVVFHLATRNVRLSLAQPTLVHDVNTAGTLSVLAAAAGAGVRRFLYCSSSEVNGTADVVPMPEEYLYRPETIYGASKLTGEYYTSVFHRSGWLPTVIARPHNNYGPRAHYAGDKGEVIPRFILWALAGQPLLIHGDGRQTRDFTYVEETADFLVRLLECDGALGQTVNVCRGEEVSILDIAHLVCELTSTGADVQHLPGRPSDVLRLFGDPTRLRSLLGTSPTVSITDGLARTVAWYRESVALNEGVLESLDAHTWSRVEREPWLERALTSQARRAA